MGKTKGRYNPEFEVGTFVQIVDRAKLLEFISSWKFHNKLDGFQLEFAGRIAKVSSVGFYHGGDELYELEGIPGVWHESNLEMADG